MQRHELQQLVAMSVVRACENVVPVVRCTMDGWSVAIDAAGVLGEELPLRGAAGAAGRVLAVDVTLGAGKPPPFGWLRRSSGWLFGLLLAVGVAFGARRTG